MEFYKYHGTGNDFVILEGMEEGPFLSPQDIRAICRRHSGVGADGVIFVCSSDSADAAMRIFNADGSEAEMCGNGIRCLAKYIYEKKGSRANPLYIETAAGTLSLKVLLKENRVEEVEVDMGLPEFISKDLPTSADPSGCSELVIPIEEGDAVKAICLSMGNPHCILFVDDVASAPVHRLGPLLERHPLFPNRTNVEFAQIVDPNHIKLRVWERGVGETQACGSGACAAFVAALNSERGQTPMEVQLPGGILKLRTDTHGHVIMTGPAMEVFRGELSPGWRG